MSASSYSKSDRALHGLALGIRSVAELSFDLEQKTQHPDGEAIKNNTHVFIAGLARAGTTVLIRRLYASGCFGSLELSCNVYEALVASHKTDVTFISFGSLCVDPSIWPKLITYTGLRNYEKDVEALRHATHEVSERVPLGLSDRANRLHEQLQSIQVC